MIPIDFDILIFKEDHTFVSYCPELDLSSCGSTVEEAREHLKTAVRLFLEEAEKLGTLEDLLIEAGYKKDTSGKWHPPRMVATELASMA